MIGKLRLRMGWLLRKPRLRMGWSLRKPRKAMVLAMVLVVVAVLTLGCLSFAEWMMTERRAAVQAVRQAQARAAADSGIEMAKCFLMQTPEAQFEAGGVYDNSQSFRGVLVADDSDPRQRARFALVAPSVEDNATSAVRYGLEDESSRLNLNTLLTADKTTKGSGRKILMGLQGMTEQIADAILDWLDADDQSCEFGAELDYYSTLTPAYAPKNGPLTSIEDLLLVRGVTPSLLFGCDTDRNGIVDAQEAASATASGEQATDASANRGWAAALTLYSLERNTRSDGQPRVDINQDDMQALSTALDEALGNADWAAFIIAWRQNGAYTGTKPGETLTGITPDLNKKGTQKFTTVLDLIDAKVQMQIPGDENPKVIESPFRAIPGSMEQWLTAIMDNLTVNPAPVIPGRINVNQASRTVLTGIPGMTSQMVDAILTQRMSNPTQDQPLRRHETWLLAEGIVKLEEMKALMPFVCAGGCVFRCQSVGYSDGEGPVARIEAIVDVSTGTPKVIFYRDLTHLGRGFSRQQLGVGTN